jgi:plasmid maintenance system antidote protein VapI
VPRLARFFAATPEFWLNLQTRCDLTVSSRRDAQRIEREVPGIRTTRTDSLSVSSLNFSAESHA